MQVRLYPAVKLVVGNLDRLQRHRFKVGKACVPVLLRFQHVGDGHGCDLDAEFAKDADGPVHMKVAGEENFPARHVRHQASCVDSVFVSALRLPLRDDGLARNAFGSEEVGYAWAAAAADHDFLEATALPCQDRVASPPKRRVRDASLGVPRGAKQDKNVAPWLLNRTGISVGPPPIDGCYRREDHDESDGRKQAGEPSTRGARGVHALAFSPGTGSVERLDKTDSKTSRS